MNKKNLTALAQIYGTLDEIIEKIELITIEEDTDELEGFLDLLVGSRIELDDYLGRKG